MVGVVLVIVPEPLLGPVLPQPVMPVMTSIADSITMNRLKSTMRVIKSLL
jgi:hypothetical protein